MQSDKDHKYAGSPTGSGTTRTPRNHFRLPHPPTSPRCTAVTAEYHKPLVLSPRHEVVVPCPHPQEFLFIVCVSFLLTRPPEPENSPLHWRRKPLQSAHVGTSGFRLERLSSFCHSILAHSLCRAQEHKRIGEVDKEEPVETHAHCDISSEVAGSNKTKILLPSREVGIRGCTSTHALSMRKPSAGRAVRHQRPCYNSLSTNTALKKRGQWLLVARFLARQPPHSNENTRPERTSREHQKNLGTAPRLRGL